MPGITLNNQDGFFSDLHRELFATSGGRAMNMATLSKEDKVRAQIFLAEMRIQKANDKAEKLK